VILFKATIFICSNSPALAILEAFVNKEINGKVKKK
jgi:hypothetical protein